MKSIFCLLFILSLISCEKVDCPTLAEAYEKDACNIIIKEMPLPRSRHNFYIIGKTILTQKDTVYDEENRWFCEFYKYLTNGDTIRKQKGTTIFNIHKSDTILTFAFECDGKNYK